MICLVQFAKRPIPGHVKTRLIPGVGMQEATRVHETLLQQTLRTLLDSQLGHVQLWWDAVWDDAFYLQGLFDGVVPETDVNFSTEVQEGHDLGQRMFHAVSLLLKDYKKVILVGSDCPVLDGDYLAQAIEQLDKSDIVLGPSDDGGYVLIGAKKITAGCLQDIRWGSGAVLEMTKQRLHEEKLSSIELKTLWDVDVVEDYQRWQAIEPGQPD